MEKLGEKDNLINDEIGAVARSLDQKMSLSERAKLKKSFIHKLITALFFYVGAMTLMSMLL